MDEKQGDSNNSPHESKQGSGKKAVSRFHFVKEFWAEHPDSIILLFMASVFLSPIGDLMTKTQKVWIVGAGIWLLCGAAISFFCKSYISSLRAADAADASSTAETKNHLTPADDVDPPIMARMFEGMGAPKDSLKVLAGGNLITTTREYQPIFRLGGINVLAIRRTPSGISVDAKIFGSNGRIVAQIDSNKFYINPNNSFRSENPDAHTLIVYDETTDVVLRIRYLNSSAVQLSGKFYGPHVSPLIVSDEDVRFGTSVTRGSTFRQPPEGKPAMDFYNVRFDPESAPSSQPQS